MKTLRLFLTPFIVFSILFSANVSGQIISSVEPSTVYPGQQHAELIIHGVNTSFMPGKTSVNMGPDITVTSISVQNTYTIYVFANVPASAITGPYDVTVTTKTNTGNKVEVLHGGVTIAAAGGPVRATILVNPVQSINLADFNPSNIKNAPLLFTVTLYNNNVVQDLNVAVTVSGQKLGLIATGTKKFVNEKANGIEVFTDAEFDKYKVAAISADAIQTAIQTGKLPSDVYTYQVTVTDDNGNPIYTVSSSNTITNTANKPELMNPGNPLYSDPPNINTRFPVFQWFAQANSFDFNLFEIKPGQKSSPEIILNRPTYTATNVNTASLIYPQSAPLLEEGKTYAWQIVANYSTSSGLSTLQSDLFWFTVATTPFTKSVQTVAELRVTPDEITLESGKSYKFSVKSIDIGNDTVSIKPVWHVVPAEGGTVDDEGNFTAGIHSRPVAVIATYGGMSDYATIDIKEPEKPKNIKDDSGTKNKPTPEVPKSK